MFAITIQLVDRTMSNATPEERAKLLDAEYKRVNEDRAQSGNAFVDSRPLHQFPDALVRAINSQLGTKVFDPENQEYKIIVGTREDAEVTADNLCRAHEAWVKTPEGAEFERKLHVAIRIIPVSEEVTEIDGYIRDAVKERISDTVKERIRDAEEHNDGKAKTP